MTNEPLVVEFDDPIAATVRLPGLGGELRGALVAIEIRPNDQFWIRVRVSMWSRWRTQFAVGAPSVEGIGPEIIEIWAPSEAVEVDSEHYPEVERIVCEAESAA